MTLRFRLFLFVSATVGLTVVLVTTTVSSSARRSFATLDRQRTAAMVAQFRREFASEGEQIALRLDRVAASDVILRTAVDVASNRDHAAHVNDAAMSCRCATSGSRLRYSSTRIPGDNTSD
jgi:hypothetical protein